MEKDCGGSFQIGSPGYHKFAFDGGAGSSIFDWQLHFDSDSSQRGELYRQLILRRGILWLCDKSGIDTTSLDTRSRSSLVCQQA